MSDFSNIKAITQKPEVNPFVVGSVVEINGLKFEITKLMSRGRIQLKHITWKN